MFYWNYVKWRGQSMLSVVPGPTAPAKDFIPIPNCSQSAIIYSIQVCLSFHGNASPHKHWPTTKPIMLINVAGSITFTSASPDPFTSVTRSQSEPAHLWKVQGDSARPANSGLLWQIPVELHSARRWAQGPLEDVRPSDHPHEGCFQWFGQRHSHQWHAEDHFVGIWQCVSRSLASPMGTK